MSTYEQRIAKLRAALERIKRERPKLARREQRIFWFHEAGMLKYRKWRVYCQTIVDRGADPTLGELILWMPNGIDVVPLLFRRKSLLNGLIGAKTKRAKAALLRDIAKAL